MIINPEILAILDANKIDRDDALTYLIALYNKFNPKYIPDSLKKQIYANGILNRGEKEGTIVWIVPLFKENTKEFDWVIDEFRPMFVQVRRDAGGDKKACTEKMQLFMKNNPSVTKSEILMAARAYLEQFTSGRQDITYLQRADYFIMKIQRGAGGITHESRLGQYIDIIREQKKKSETQNKHVMR